MSDLAFVETHSRSLAKAIVYRILVMITVGVMVSALGGTAAQAGAVMLAVFFIGFAVYYIHERLWLLTSWKRSSSASDHWVRSVVKTISYRVIIMIVAFITFKLILGQDNATTLAMTVAQTVINMGWFYIIERISNRIAWGKKPAEQPV